MREPRLDRVIDITDFLLRRVRDQVTAVSHDIPAKELALHVSLAMGIAERQYMEAAFADELDTTIIEFERARIDAIGRLQNLHTSLLEHRQTHTGKQDTVQ